MTSRQSALAYGVIVTCALSLVFLIGGDPSGQKLLLAILAGVAFSIGSWFWLDRR